MIEQSTQRRYFTAAIVIMLALTVAAAFSATYSYLTPYFAFGAALLAAAMRRRGPGSERWGRRS